MFALLEKLIHLRKKRTGIYMGVKAGLGRQSWRIKHFVTWSICVMGLLPADEGCAVNVTGSFKKVRRIQI